MTVGYLARVWSRIPALTDPARARNIGDNNGRMPVATRGTGVQTMPWAEGGGIPRGYRLRVLGGWDLDCGGRPFTVQLRSQRLIALLAVAGPMPRAVICGRLWPESSEAHALDSLRVTIHHVGRDLPGLLATRDSTVSLARGVAVDLDRVRAGLVDGVAGPEPGGWPGAEPELLPGWYDEWVLLEQDRLRAQRIRRHVRQAQQLFDAGDLRGAVDSAGRSLALDPLDEWSLEVLVRAQLGLGAACAARRALVSFHRALQQEFGQFSSPLVDGLDQLVAGRNADGAPPRPAAVGSLRSRMHPLASN